MSIKNQFIRIGIFLKDPDKKPLLVITKEVLKLFYLKKRFPLHYFGWFFYRKDMTNVENYLDLKEFYSIINSKKLNIPEYLPFLENKLVFSLLCEKHNINSPKVVSYNLKSEFFVKKANDTISDKENLYHFFYDQFKKTNVDKLFLKSLCGFGGIGMICLKKNDLKTQIDTHYKAIINGDFIHQIGIVQHDSINEIYPNSANTIRIDTYISNDNKIHILAAAMSFGAEGNSIGNVCSGGYFVPINMDNGTLMESGVQAMIHGGKSVTKHPDTNYRFDGFTIPFFEESKQLCLTLTKYIPNRLIGWDIAITPEGPTVLEGNLTPDITMGEFSIGGYLTHPLYKEIISNT